MVRSILTSLIYSLDTETLTPTYIAEKQNEFMIRITFQLKEMMQSAPFLSDRCLGKKIELVIDASKVVTSKNIVETMLQSQIK